MFAENILSSGCADLNLTVPEISKHSPDASYCYKGEAFPHIVIEILDSQKKRKALKSLVYDYIIGSRGSIGMVIAFDIGERSGKEATLSIWRPMNQAGPAGNTLITQAVQKDQLFRNHEGFPTGQGLRLCLKDFAIEETIEPLRSGLGLDLIGHEMVISAEDLCGLLEEAEEHVKLLKEGNGKTSQMFAGCKIAPRPESRAEDYSESGSEGDDPTMRISTRVSLFGS